jgi:hypothetical protein
MLAIDAFSLCLSVLGIYGLVLSLRYLIPCYMVPLISARLNETQQLLSHAEAINAIPPESEYRTHLDLYGDLYCILIGCHLIHRSSSANQFAAMRLQSNQARRLFQQLRLAIQRGLTCRLFIVYYQMEGIKSKLEVSQTTLLAHHMCSINSSQLAIDNQRLRIADLESAARTAVPSPAAGMHLLYYIFQG